MGVEEFSNSRSELQCGDLCVALRAADDLEDVMRIITQVREGGHLEAYSAVIERLSDERSGVRRAAAKCLAELGNQDAVEPLIVATKTAAQSEKRAFVDAIIVLGPHDRASWCVEVFEENNWKLRKKEALGLAEFAGLDALPLIADSTQKIVWEGKDGIQIELMRILVRRILERQGVIS